MVFDRPITEGQAGSLVDLEPDPDHAARPLHDPPKPGHDLWRTPLPPEVTGKSKRLRRFTGRPANPPGTSRTRVLAVKLSDQDRHRIEQRALKAGLGVSTYVREAALKARVVPARNTAALTLAEMAQIAQLQEIAVTIAREAPRLGRAGGLPPEVAQAFARLTALTDLITNEAAARDRADAHRQRIITELTSIGRNLNQITRAVNAIARQRGSLHDALPPFTRAVLADIAALIERLVPILGRDREGER